MAVLVLALLVSIGASIAVYRNFTSANDVLQTQKKKMMEQDLALGKAQTDIGNAQKALQKMEGMDDVKQWLKDNGSKASDAGVWKARYEQAVKGSGQKIQVVLQKDPNDTKPQIVIVPSQNNGVAGSTGTGYIVASGTIDNLGDYIWVSSKNDGKPDTKVSDLTLVHKDYRIDISANVLKNAFQYTLHQNFEGSFVKAINPTNGAVSHFVRIWELDDKGKRLKQMDITDFKMVTDDPSGGKRKWFWWNPQIDLGANVSVSNRLRGGAGGEIGFSTSGSGVSKDDNDWRFFRFSVTKQKNNDIILNFAPTCYNAGKPLPLVKDLYLCPTVGLQGSDTVVGFSVYNPF